MQFDCGTCHKPHAPTPAEAIAPCTSCHVVSDTAGKHARHLKQACTTCHAPHLWVAGRAECVACHAAAEKHAAGKGCTGCHLFRSVPGARK
jgi:hypothetical protein